MWPTALLSSNHADVLTFSMILMLINIQVRALDLSGDSVFRHVERHDLTSHQQKHLRSNGDHSLLCHAPFAHEERGLLGWLGPNIKPIPLGCLGTE